MGRGGIARKFILRNSCKRDGAWLPRDRAWLASTSGAAVRTTGSNENVAWCVPRRLNSRSGLHDQVVGAHLLAVRSPEDGAEFVGAFGEVGEEF